VVPVHNHIYGKIPSARCALLSIRALLLGGA
jgi:hypothetical protein